MDARIRFNPLSPVVMRQVVDKFMRELADQLADKGVTLELTAAARQYLADKGHDPANGARPLGRLVQDEIKRPLGDELLFGKLEHGGHVRVGLRDGKVHFQLDSKSPSSS